MKTWIVSYGDAAFRLSLQRLMSSAARFGIDEQRPWDRDALQKTSLYAVHKSLLGERRGAGYWLWKPFIIKETLKEMGPGDILVYSDAGIEIVADLAPMLDICATRSDVMLFAGTYEDVGAPGPNSCAKWTKRDCFVFMDCDNRRYHQGPMIDASMIVLRRTPRAVALVRDWLLHCCQRQLLTDDPNVCGLPNLPEFIEHRHDQSLLSLISIRDTIELFRHPSQYGEDCTTRAYDNSPYDTLINHHRGAVGSEQLGLDLNRTLLAVRERVFEAWTRPEVLMHWSPLGYRVLAAEADVRVGGEYRLTLATKSERMSLSGTYLDVERPARLVYSWRWNTRVTVEFRDCGEATAVAVRHEQFPTEQMLRYHLASWEAFFDNLTCQLDVRTCDTH